MEKSNLELLREKGIEIKRTGKTTCPECSHTRKKKNDPCLSVNVEDGWFRCHNCSWSGRVYNKREYVPKTKVYTKPQPRNITDVSQPILDWFFKRGIQPLTVKKFKITQGERFFPQVSQNRGCMEYNYFRDDELINIKYRDHEKNFMLNKDSELIFYNLDSIRETESVVIVEGECDAMIVDQIGIHNVISVPNGATLSKNPNLDYLDNCSSYFENKTKIIIATDNDEAGRALRDELSRRFGKHRCYKVDFSDQKDANDYFLRYGEKNLKAVFSDDNLIEFPVEGITMVNDHWTSVEDLFRNGLQKGDVTGIMPELDKLISFVPGQTCVITGIPNHGKSPFVLMIAASLSIKHGWKWAFFTPEHKPLSIFIAKICELLLGKRLRQGVGFMESEKTMARDFMQEHFFFIEPENGDNTVESVLDKVQHLVMTKGIKGAIYDPWNKFEHKLEKGENETMYISRALDKIIYSGQSYGVFNFIIAHPTKIRKNLQTGKYEVPTLYDIAGSANWYNKPDWGITFYRDFQTNKSTAYVQKAKWEHLGMVGYVEFKYNINNGRFVPSARDYDNTNWILPEVMQGDLFNATEIETPIPMEPIPDMPEIVTEEIKDYELEKISTDDLEEDEAPF